LVVTGEIPDVRTVRVTQVAAHPTLAQWSIVIVVVKNNLAVSDEFGGTLFLKTIPSQARKGLSFLEGVETRW
jgi:hypothetical protein